MEADYLEELLLYILVIFHADNIKVIAELEEVLVLLLRLVVCKSDDRIIELKALGQILLHKRSRNDRLVSLD